MDRWTDGKGWAGAAKQQNKKSAKTRPIRVASKCADINLHRTTMRLGAANWQGRAVQTPGRPRETDTMHKHATYKLLTCNHNRRVGVWCAERTSTQIRMDITLSIFIERIRVDTNVRNTQRQTDNGTENKWWMEAREGNRPQKPRRRGGQLRHRQSDKDRQRPKQSKTKQNTHSDTATDTDRSPLGRCGALGFN